MYFWTYRLRKTWLDKCPKSQVSEDPWTSDTVNWPKHCWNLNGSTFTIFIGHCERNSVAKSLSFWYAKYSDNLLTHWLSMTSVLFLIRTIFCNITRYNYLRDKIFFTIFFAFSKFTLNFEHFQKKNDPHSWCIFELMLSQKRS